MSVLGIGCDCSIFFEHTRKLKEKGEIIVTTGPSRFLGEVEERPPFAGRANSIGLRLCAICRSQIEELITFENQYCIVWGLFHNWELTRLATLWFKRLSKRGTLDDWVFELALNQGSHPAWNCEFSSVFKILPRTPCCSSSLRGVGGLSCRTVGVVRTCGLGSVFNPKNSCISGLMIAYKWIT